MADTGGELVLKIALVTSWLPRWCGIATYSEKLAGALRAEGIDVEVVCHTDGGRPGESRVHPVMDQHDPAWHHALYRTVEGIDPDVVHVQHEFGIFSYTGTGLYDYRPETAFELTVPLFKWKARRRPVVITYHSVLSRMTRAEALYYDYACSLATANIVHEPYQKDALPLNLGRSVPNVFVCPHGASTDRPTPLQVKAAREDLGVDGRPVVGMIGWWEPNKGFERVVELWPRIVAKVPEAVLVVAGEARPGSPSGPGYREKLLPIIEASPARNAIKVVHGLFSPAEFVRTVSAFDFMVLPYNRASQSGNHAHAYQAGIPTVVSALEGLKSSVEASGAGIIAHDDRELEQAILRLLQDEETRLQMAARAVRYVEEVCGWPLVARKHIAIYRWVLERIQEAGPCAGGIPTCAGGIPTCTG